MGFSGGEAKEDSYYYYGEGLMEVWLDDVTCNGLESSLEQCAHKGYGVHDCVGHIESAAVKCTESIVYPPSVPSVPSYQPAGLVPPYISAPEHVPSMFVMYNIVLLNYVW